MTPNEERAQLVAPMELIGKAIQQCHDLFKDTNYVCYDTVTVMLTHQLKKLQDHDNYLITLDLP